MTTSSAGAGTPEVVAVESSGPPRAVLLLLHGGGDRDAATPVGPLRPGWLQVRRLQRALARQDASLSYWAVKNQRANWSEDPTTSPAADARVAVRRARERHPGIPIVLVGHSMGGRSAIRAADEEAVVGVVGLAAWVPVDEPVVPLSGRSVYLAYVRLEHWPGCRRHDQLRFAEGARAVASAVHVEDLGLNIHPLLLVDRHVTFVLSSVEEMLRRGAARRGRA